MTSARSEREPTTAIQRRRLAFSAVEQRMIARWRTNGPRRGATITVGFSGGPDSLGLAAALGRISPRFDVRAHLIHVDHGLRPGSTQEAAHARALADALGLPIEIAAIPAGLAGRHPGVGLEEAARRERYLLLGQCAAALGTDLIVTGHHLDDQVETVMLHLLRGAGLTGAAAIREWSELVVPWWTSENGTTFRIWRPLLGEQKAELSCYVQQLGLDPNRDESNSDPAFRRNAIRHRLLPTIDACVPEGRAALARFAEIAGAEDSFLAELAADATSAAVDDVGKLVIAETIHLPAAIRRRVLMNWLGGVLPFGVESTYERVVALDMFLRSSSEDKLLEIGGGHLVARLGGKIVAGSRSHVEEACWSMFRGPRLSERDQLPCSLQISEVHSFAHFVVSVVPPIGEYDDHAPEFAIKLRVADVVEPLVIRRVEAGDRFASGVPVSDWLSARGVPAIMRRRILCVAGGHGVVWIPGVDLPRASVPLAGDDTILGKWSVRA